MNPSLSVVDLSFWPSFNWLESGKVNFNYAFWKKATIIKCSYCFLCCFVQVPWITFETDKESCWSLKQDHKNIHNYDLTENAALLNCYLRQVGSPWCHLMFIDLDKGAFGYLLGHPRVVVYNFKITHTHTEPRKTEGNIAIRIDYDLIFILYMRAYSGFFTGKERMGNKCLYLKWKCT